ncbi:hypothetical protein FA13DRAFT_1708346 [Coprinellus micaceus]|uniref:Uncharacterized protein n=1 Tax=Coprinellus micaceus TaxID=71717 RepID=A0A4Y7THB4_COPMI|nr:hypothetical protein FA13DRAFT_1708346 [Coprinellus micaceus]
MWQSDVGKWLIVLLEDTAGQARMLLGLPSLVHSSQTESCDSSQIGQALRLSPSLIPAIGWSTAYAFYHKSLLDYLEDPQRLGAGGETEVPMDPTLLLVFRCCFVKLFPRLFETPTTRLALTEDFFSKCELGLWLGTASRNIRVLDSFVEDAHLFARAVFRVVHQNCSCLRCRVPCKLLKEGNLENDSSLAKFLHKNLESH